MRGYINDHRVSRRRPACSDECEYTDCSECDGFVGDADYDCLCDCHLEEDDGQN